MPHRLRDLALRFRASTDVTRIALPARTGASSPWTKRTGNPDSNDPAGHWKSASRAASAARLNQRVRIS